MVNNNVTFKALGDLLAEPLLNGLTRPKAVRGAGTKMVNMGEIFAHSRILNLPMDRVPLSDNEQRFLLKADDLLFARQSLVLSGAGKCSIFLGDEEQITYESHIIRVRLDHTLTSPLFYYYFFTSPVGRQAIESIVEQVAAAGIRGSDLARLKVPYLPVEEQRAIARVLGALDDKIELNRRQNTTLEELARTIFKSWFVDFDPVRARVEGRAPAAMDAATAALFPDGFEERDGREVPRGWRYVPLKEFLTLKRGYDLPQAQREAGAVPIVSSSGVSGTHSTAKVTGPGVVTGRYGTIGQVFFIESHFWPLNTTLYVQDFKRNEPRIAYYILSNINFNQFTDKAAVPGINRNHVHEQIVILPDIDVQRAFSQLTGPFFKQAALNTAQNKTLAALRDALLPRLLSGELRVHEAERLVEERV